ncbi:hypothetical protein LTR53_015217 [Teratosphaeriaceae sp. CCFEE 6253]|nr:hypothetical protein LTR53_015217 [Teratosphaeriaceae sp. CCFEE 6253]
MASSTTPGQQLTAALNELVTMAKAKNAVDAAAAKNLATIIQNAVNYSVLHL